MVQCSLLAPARGNLAIILAWQTPLVGRGVGDVVSFPVYAVVFPAGRCSFELEEVFIWIVFLPILPTADGSSPATAGSASLLAALAWKGDGGAQGSVAVLFQWASVCLS